MKKIIIGFTFVVLLSIFGAAGYILGWNEGLAEGKNSVYIDKQPPPLDKNELWSLIQKWRISQGLLEYTEDNGLCEIAKDRVDDEILDYHKGFIDKYSNYRYAVKENLAYAFSEQEVLNGWLNSPPHRKALESSFKYSCIEVAGYYAVHIFSNL